MRLIVDLENGQPPKEIPNVMDFVCWSKDNLIEALQKLTNNPRINYNDNIQIGELAKQVSKKIIDLPGFATTEEFYDAVNSVLYENGLQTQY